MSLSIKLFTSFGSSCKLYSSFELLCSLKINFQFELRIDFVLGCFGGARSFNGLAVSVKT